MPLFGIDSGPPSAAGISVDVAPYRVFVARISPAGDPTADPTWADFAEETRLKVVHWQEGSTLGGMSRAKLTLAVGAPVTSPSTLRVEQFDVLHQGDRVIIGQGRGSNIRMLFAGYMTGAHLGISADAESITFNLSGPEWLIGGKAGAGTWKCVSGQLRRKAAADDKYFSFQTPVTDYPDIILFTDERAVFNPDGHKNRTTAKVNLTASGTPDPVTGNSPAQLKGYIWEIPDRAIFKSTSTYVDYWTKLDALQAIWTWFNDPAKTGIAQPDWSAASDVLESIDTDMILRSVDVDGMGLWEATRAILGPQYGCYLTPAPVNDQQPNVPAWSGFVLKFIARGEGPDASSQLVLNPLGTPASQAKPGIVRLEAVKDISKTVNRVRVYGKFIRHIRLMYYGDDTPTIGGDTGDDRRNIALQHGWKQSEGNLKDYAVQDTNTHDWVIDLAQIESQSEDIVTKWTDKFTRTGPKFEANKHVFRLFTWNEAGEFYSANGGMDGPCYGTTPTQQNWWNPDLSQIASSIDDGDGSLNYCRRRRKLLDTVYQDTGIDDWRRVMATLYIAGMGPDTDTDDPSSWDWVEVPRSHYRLDHERAAVWITVKDLSDWRPLEDQPDPSEPTLSDLRTFATLLHNGDLRMMVEASVETDFALDETAERQSVSGSPFVREMVLRKPADFVYSVEYDDGLDSPTGLDPDPLDNSDDAMSLAEQTRAALQDQESHASITMSADAPRIEIGSLITQTSGRSINLASDGTGTKGAQVVARVCDPLNNKIELLTESDVLKLGRRKRKSLRGKAQHATKIPGVPKPPTQVSGDGPGAPGPQMGLA